MRTGYAAKNHANANVGRLASTTSLVPYSKAITVELADAGKRAADAINKAIFDAGGWWNVRERWMAVRLRDGHCDGTIYDTLLSAVWAKRNRDPHAFVALRALAGGASARELAVVIKFQRDAHDAGFRMPDPAPIVTAGQRDYLRGVMGL